MSLLHFITYQGIKMCLVLLIGKVEGFNPPLAKESNLITFGACKMQNWEAAVNKVLNNL